jgi:hypothetical protein
MVATTPRLLRTTDAAPIPTTRHAVHDYVLWIGAAAALGFAVSFIFSGLLEMPRSWFLLFYVGASAPFLIAYFRWTGVDIPRALRHHWRIGTIGAVVIGAFTVFRMLQEDASPRPEGLALVGDILWLGVVYGAVDALLLSVLPVSAVWLAMKSLGRTSTWKQKIFTGVVAMLASIVVTTAYHLGFAEYRDSTLASPMIGNSIFSLGYLLTANPITAVFAHIAMHIASVIHGIDTTVTLPPHY